MSRHSLLASSIFLILVITLGNCEDFLNTTSLINFLNNSTLLANETGNLHTTVNESTDLNTTDIDNRQVIVQNSTEEKIPDRIIGGVPITIAQAPYQVAVIRNGFLICGGSVLSRQWILTAAHCTVARGNYVVRAGTRHFRQGGQTRKVVRIATYGGYNARTSENDIAMLQLKDRFHLSKYVKPVRLPASNSGFPGSFIVSGWGVVSRKQGNISPVLKGAIVNYVKKNKCSNLYKSQITLATTMFCAAASGKDSCQGDSGGPLVNDGVQYGVVSFGIGCANPNYPGVYTDLKKYVSWIKNVMNRYK